MTSRASCGQIVTEPAHGVRPRSAIVTLEGGGTSPTLGGGCGDTAGGGVFG
jgi:hypothetical protein